MINATPLFDTYCYTLTQKSKDQDMCLYRVGLNYFYRIGHCKNNLFTLKIIFSHLPVLGLHFVVHSIIEVHFYIDSTKLPQLTSTACLYCLEASKEPLNH